MNFVSGRIVFGVGTSAKPRYHARADQGQMDQARLNRAQLCPVPRQEMSVNHVDKSRV